MLLWQSAKWMLLYLLLVGDSLAGRLELSEITGQMAQSMISQGDFQQQKHLKVLRKPLVSSGRFTYHQAKGVIWETLSPVQSVLLVNGSKLLADQGEQAMPVAFAKVFNAMLGGDFAKLNDGFTLTGSKENRHWQIQLTPKDGLVKKLITGISLTGDTELRALVIQEANGDSTHIKFTRISHPTGLTAGQEANFERLSP